MTYKGRSERRSTPPYVLVGALVGALLGACSDSKEPRPPLGAGDSTGVPALGGGQGSPATSGKFDGGTTPTDAGETVPSGASVIQATIGGERVVFAVNARCTVDINGTLVVQGETASAPPRGVVLTVSAGDGGLRTSVMTLDVFGSSPTSYGSNVGNGTMEVQIRSWPQGAGDRARGTFGGRLVPASQAAGSLDVFDGTFDVTRVN